MTLKLKLLDHIQINSRVHNTSFSCEYSEDGKIFLLLDSGVCVFTLKGSIDNIFPRFSFKKDIITLSNISISDTLDIDLSSFINELKRHSLYEAVLDVTLCGNDLNATAIESKPVCAMWSPRGIVEKTEGALAVLTNLHNIEIYIEVTDENEISSFMRVVNFSKDISELYRRTWKKVDALSGEDQFLELKKRVDLVIPTAFTWSHVILKDRKACCILFVGHKDGSISAWRFVERKANEVSESRLQFLESYSTKFQEITALCWFCTNSDEGGMAIGDINGQIGALSVSDLSTDKIRFENEVALNLQNDLKVDKITVFNFEDITYVVAVKRNFIQIYAVSDYAEAFVGKIVEVGNLYITGILHYEKKSLLVLSVCGQLKQLDFSITDEDDARIIISEKNIPLNIDTNKYRTHGFVLSPNKVFLAVLAYPCQVKDLSRGKNFVNFFVFSNTGKSSFELLINISSSNLRDHWDCFETLRVTCLQKKIFPWRGIQKDLNYDTLPLIKLKVLRWISKLSETIYPTISRIEEYNIKPYVLLNYAVDIKLAVGRMTKLLNIYFSEKKLSLFQMQSLDLLNFFLKEMIAKDILAKANLGETFIDEIYGVMRIANEIQYPPMPQCLWCGERIIGSSCVPYHADSRCSISLMPTYITPGYKCPFCKCIVSKEIEKEYYPIFCPYCDIPMKRRHFDKKSETVNTDDIVTSECFSDCLKDDTQHFSDIEENTVDYVVLTDSEDEKDELLRDVYLKIKKISLASTPYEANEVAVPTASSNVSVEENSPQSTHRDKKSRKSRNEDSNGDDENGSDEDYEDNNDEYDED